MSAKTVTVELCCGTKDCPPAAVCGECTRELQAEPRITHAMFRRLMNWLYKTDRSAVVRDRLLHEAKRWRDEENARD